MVQNLWQTPTLGEMNSVKFATGLVSVRPVTVLERVLFAANNEHRT